MSMPGWQDSQARDSQNGEVIGPLTGQIMPPEPGWTGPAGSVPALPPRDAAAWPRSSPAGRCSAPTSSWSCVALRRACRRARSACRARALEPPRVPMSSLLTSATSSRRVLDRGGELLLARLERRRAASRRRSRRLRGRDAVDDARSWSEMRSHELAALEQVGEAVGVEDHGDEVGRVGLVELDEAGGQGGRASAEPGSQADEPRALVRAGRPGCARARRGLALRSASMRTCRAAGRRIRAE